MRSTDDFLSETQALHEGYYSYDGESLAEITRRWQQHNDKLYDPMKKVRHGWHTMYAHGLFPVRELWSLREFTWTREKGRRSPKEWDTLKKSIEAEGFQEPIHLLVGKSGKPKVGEGNHRLAIAREIGMKQVPVVIQFVQKV